MILFAKPLILLFILPSKRPTAPLSGVSLSILNCVRAGVIESPLPDFFYQIPLSMAEPSIGRPFL